MEPNGVGGTVATDDTDETGGTRDGAGATAPAEAEALADRLFQRTAELASTSRRLACEAAQRKRLEDEKLRLLGELEEAVRFRDEFLSIASHEFKTPVTALQLQLQAILGWLQRNPIEGPAGERLAARIRIAERQVDRLTRLVDGLLALTSLSAGRPQLELEQVDLAALLRDVAGRFEEEARRAQAPVLVQADGPLIGHWDRLRLEQVFTNLLSNAVKFGAHKPIELTATTDDGLVRVEVTDQGIGVPPEDHERIFHRFGRAVSGRHYGGFGLGLWMAREAAEALGGAISVASRAGHGATFTVILPRDTEQARTAAHASSPRP